MGEVSREAVGEEVEVGERNDDDGGREAHQVKEAL